jgi:maleate cis-trans isomerase
MTKAYSATAQDRGWKVGLIVPMNNTTMAREITGWLPPGSELEVLRIPRGKGLITPDVLPEYVRSTLDLAAGMSKDLDVIAYGCTAAGFVAGPEGEARLAQDLQTVTGTAVVTTARSMVLALRELGARRIALVSPYSESVNRALMKFLDEDEIEVEELASFNAADVDALGRITEDEVADLARRTMTDSCDVMFIACSQLPTFGVLDSLSAEFGRPVMSSIKATALQAHRAAKLGHETP